MQSTTYIVRGGRYEATPLDFVFYPHFWVSFDEGKTELCTNANKPGHYTYYEVQGDVRKEVKAIVALLGESSPRALVSLFKKHPKFAKDN